MKNKKILSIIAVLVLILGITPYFVGNLARKKIDNIAAEISKIPGYDFEIREYNQGWFTSHAVVTYGFDEHTLNILKNSAAQNDDIDASLFKALKNGLTFDVTVAHGPVTFQNGLNFALLSLSGYLQDIDLENYKQLKKQANVDSLIDLFATVSYGGTTNVLANSPAFKVDFSDTKGKKLTLDYTGINIKTSINAAMDNYEAHVNMDKLAIETGQGALSLNQLTAQSYGQKINDYLWIGNGTTSLGGVELSVPSAQPLSLNNFTTDYNLGKESDTTLGLHLVSTTAEILVADIAIRKFNLDLNMNHLNLEAVTDYVKSIKEAYQPKDAMEDTPEQMALRLQEIATRVGEKIFKGSPELIVNNMAFSLGDGSFSGDASLNINGDGLEKIQELSDPIALNKRLATIVNLNFDKALAEALSAIGMKKQMAAAGMDISSVPKDQFDQMVKAQTGTMLQTFVTQGYFSVDGENYKTRFEMKNGQRLVNGKPLPIPGM